MKTTLLVLLLAVGGGAGCSAEADPPSSPDPGFAGVWLDRRGALVVSWNGEALEGTLVSTSGARLPLRGRVRDGAFSFVYGAPTPAGQGRIELMADGASTVGTLSAAEGTPPQVWQGIRLHRDPKRHVEVLIDAIQLDDERRRRAAIDVLGILGPAARAAVPALLEALGDADAAMADAAELALARIGPASASELIKLMCALRSPSARARAGAAEALGSLGPAAEDAVDLLDASMEDKDPEVRRAVARARQRIRSGRASGRSGSCGS